MKINIKDVLKNDTEKADLHSEHWLTDAMEAEQKSAPEESESAEMPDTDSDPGVEAFESEMPDTDSEEEIPEAEELAEELTEGILSEPETAGGAGVCGIHPGTVAAGYAGTDATAGAAGRTCNTAGNDGCSADGRSGGSKNV
mgnify:CR=1 FL=1